MRILIAEDSLISRRLLETTLWRWGHEVIVTSDGAEAWRVLQGEQPPPLAIIDWMMPRLDGLELCRRIRHAKDRPSLYIILLTAAATQKDIEAALEAGVDDYLVKPFDPLDLQAHVEAGCRIVESLQGLPHRAR